ncbi:5-deoxy-glucuronate isomerase [Limimaricola pyoseonensis]|uniref:5-deoxy-glucuronate isomerase n=1 Tax=Limimaricola pyoseonensis TaxID=521013 RepID=A0A1G6ZIX8_9RHOB|nr:5-deoxy-glucuronate isomerase [Limimaricola pyoseonensis]SDE02568.1 5-deoxy-glucuronate isomerase [Limimaricola pyoseonensis]
MAEQLFRPAAGSGRVIDITPGEDGPARLGFALWRLAEGEGASLATRGRAAVLVIVEGRAELTAGEVRFGEMGARDAPFDGHPPHAIYIPAGSDWSARATSGCVIALCTAPASPGGAPRALGPKGLHVTRSGEDALAHGVVTIAEEDRDRIGLREILTPPGHWSPGWSGESDEAPARGHEAIFYHRLDPADEHLLQRLDGGVREIGDGVAGFAPRGRAPFAAPPGARLYTLELSLSRSG